MEVETKVNLLLVDDRPENLLALSAILDDLGQYHVLARSGREALSCVLREDFAAILLDVQMPGMDGFETATIIRSCERARSVPILFMTAHSEEETQVFRGYALGAVDSGYSSISTGRTRSFGGSPSSSWRPSRRPTGANWRGFVRRGRRSVCTRRCSAKRR
jgi:CheY-like chemotaxis protein